MKKNMKKVGTFIISIAMLTIFAMPCLATDVCNSDLSNLKVISSTTNLLSKAESITALMSNKGLSYNQALQEYTAMTARSERLEERYITYDAGMGYIIEVGCQVKVACGSGHCNFVEVIKEWSDATGSGSYTWKKFYVTVTIEGATKDTLRFQTRGALEVAVDSSTTGGFEAAGFSVSSTTGGTTYYRKTISIN